MLKIYGCYRSRASRIIWLAEEAGFGFEIVPVVQAARGSDTRLHTKSPSFLKINPNGLIPTVDDDGLVLNESLAINLHLAKKHGGPLAPANLAEDALMTMWTVWLVAEVEPHSVQILYHMAAKPPGERDPKIAQAAIEALRGRFAVLDAALAKSGWLVGGRFTVADINAAEVFRYAQPAGELFDAAPRVKDWIGRCQSRPAFKKMMAARDAEPV